MGAVRKGDRQDDTAETQAESEIKTGASAQMSFVQRELEHIRTALLDSRDSSQRAELYAAQQALSWALEPSGYATPYAMIRGIREGSEDYSAPVHLPLS